ncbi:MAG TPA: right-handed parallel beta-helix repeat-containing protein, partial [Candidatus Limnocylindrales bacterium]
MNHLRMYRPFAIAAVGILLVALLPGSALAATIYVGPGGGAGGCLEPTYTTIGDAVTAAGSTDTIHVCAGNYTGLVTITGKDLTFVGDGVNSTIISGESSNGLFATDSAITVTDMTLQDGAATAAISVSGSAAVVAMRVVFTTNQGGAIAAPTSPVSVNDSTFDSNLATNGAAIAAATLTVSNSTFVNNVASVSGGAIFAANATILNSTFSGNSATSGAVIRASGAVTISNSILAGTGTTNCAGGGAFTDGEGNLSTDISCGFFSG